MKKKILFLFNLLLTLTCFGIVFASNSAGNGARNAIGATGNTFVTNGCVFEYSRASILAGGAGNSWVDDGEVIWSN